MLAEAERPVLPAELVESGVPPARVSLRVPGGLLTRLDMVTCPPGDTEPPDPAIVVIPFTVACRGLAGGTTILATEMGVAITCPTVGDSIFLTVTTGEEAEEEIPPALLPVPDLTADTTRAMVAAEEMDVLTGLAIGMAAMPGLAGASDLARALFACDLSVCWMEFWIIFLVLCSCMATLA